MLGVSDKVITSQSDFLDLIELYDAVLADRGFFPISEELTRKRATLLIPQGQNGVNQITSSDVYLTKAIANRPIYIKQAFLRIECFRILQYQVSQSLIYHLDDIVKSIACICNIYPPLPSNKVKN